MPEILKIKNFNDIQDWTCKYFEGKLNDNSFIVLVTANGI